MNRSVIAGAPPVCLGEAPGKRGNSLTQPTPSIPCPAKDERRPCGGEGGHQVGAVTSKSMDSWVRLF